MFQEEEPQGRSLVLKRGDRIKTNPSENTFSKGFVRSKATLKKIDEPVRV